MPSGVSSLIGGLQGAAPAASPYAGAPGLNQQQTQNILRQLRSGGASVAPPQMPQQSMMGALPAGANPQAALSQMVGAAPQSMTGNYFGPGQAPQAMQGFNGFGGMAPMQAGAYAQNPQQTGLEGMVRGLGGMSPVQPSAYAQNPYAYFAGY